ncbi:MAG: MBL fold metallo-hydrolase [Thaumarchaeota archaeon]|nr:MBL fold metallo-hydrolase [Nitrososphaerota archaeon]
MSEVVMVDDQPLLFDCGERTTTNLMRAGINPVRVNQLFITHHHWDHMSDYGYFCICTWNYGRKETLHVYGPQGTIEMSDHILLGGHKLDVEFLRKFGRNLPPHIKKKPTSEIPIEVQDLKDTQSVSGAGWKVTAGLVEHLSDFPCLGYRVDSPQGSVAISGDTQPCEAMIKLAADVDVLVHECSFLDEIISERQMKGHSGPTGAGRVAQESGAKKLVITHLRPYVGPPPVMEMATMYWGNDWIGEHIIAKIVTDIRKQYDGEIIIGRDCMEIQI